MIVDVYQNKVVVNGELTDATPGGQPHLFSNQKVSIIRVNRTLPTVVYPIVLVHLALRVIVLELKHDIREAVYGSELFRSVSMNLVEIHVGADSPWGVRGLVGFRCGTGWECTIDEETH